MDLNRATILGRLTRDPESRTTGSGIVVTNFSVATSTVWTDAATKEKKELTEFHNIVAWRRLGEIVAQYLKKSNQVYVEGRIQTRSYEAQDGTKKYRTEIIADNLIMLGSKGQGASPAGERADEVRYEPATAKQAPHTDSSAAAPQSGAQTEEISVEDIPF